MFTQVSVDERGENLAIYFSLKIITQFQKKKSSFASCYEYIDATTTVLHNENERVDNLIIVALFEEYLQISTLQMS